MEDAECGNDTALTDSPTELTDDDAVAAAAQEAVTHTVTLGSLRRMFTAIVGVGSEASNFGHFSAGEEVVLLQEVRHQPRQSQCA
jgi:hypothetical protein